MFTKASQNS